LSFKPLNYFTLQTAVGFLVCYDPQGVKLPHIGFGQSGTSQSWQVFRLGEFYFFQFPKNHACIEVICYCATTNLPFSETNLAASAFTSKSINMMNFIDPTAPSDPFAHHSAQGLKTGLLRAKPGHPVCTKSASFISSRPHTNRHPRFSLQMSMGRNHHQYYCWEWMNEWVLIRESNSYTVKSKR